MKFDLNEFRTDATKKTQGVWIDFGCGARVKVASFDNQDFANEFRRMVEPYTKMGRDIPSDEQRRVMVHCMSRYIVLDWEGIYDGDNQLPFSVQNAERVLEEIEWFRDRVIEEARKIANFRKEQAEKIEGNCETASGGTPSSGTDSSC